MTGMTGFLIAVGVVSSILFVLMLRSDRVRNRRRAYADMTGSETGGAVPGHDGFTLLNWFGGDSASSSSGDSCPSSSIFSGGDSGCSDGGGGDGGGGSGGD